MLFFPPVNWLHVAVHLKKNGFVTVSNLGVNSPILAGKRGHIKVCLTFHSEAGCEAWRRVRSVSSSASPTRGWSSACRSGTSPSSLMGPQNDRTWQK